MKKNIPAKKKKTKRVLSATARLKEARKRPVPRASEPMFSPWAVLIGLTVVVAIVGLSFSRPSVGDLPQDSANPPSPVAMVPPLGSQQPGKPAASPIAEQAGRPNASSLLGSLHLINYYPAGHAQTKLWTEFESGTVNRDFGLVRAMNANAVRVPLFPRAFGYPDPNPEMLGKLTELLTIAGKYRLQVKLSLFGFWSSFRDIEGSKQWLTSVLGPYRDDPRIVAIDLGSELNLDDPVHVTWAKEILAETKRLAGSIPVTIAVAGSDGDTGLKKLLRSGITPDFYEMDYYGKAELACTQFQRALETGVTTLFVGETGASTALTDGRSMHTASWWEAQQSKYHRTVAYAANQLGITAAPWIFSDFTPDAFPLTSQDRLEANQYLFGLLRTDGSPKPAAQFIASLFGGTAIDTSFNNGFEDVDEAEEPLEWSVWQHSAATFRWDPNVQHSGLASVMIGGVRSKSVNNPAYYTSPVQCIWPSQPYTASVWAMGEGIVGQPRISLVWFDRTGGTIGSDSSEPLAKGETDWTKLEVTAAAPVNAASVQIHLLLQSRNSSQEKVWFDDVEFASAP